MQREREIQAHTRSFKHNLALPLPFFSSQTCLLIYFFYNYKMCVSKQNERILIRIYIVAFKKAAVDSHCKEMYCIVRLATRQTIEKSKTLRIKITTHSCAIKYVLSVNFDSPNKSIPKHFPWSRQTNNIHFSFFVFLTFRIK